MSGDILFILLFFLNGLIDIFELQFDSVLSVVELVEQIVFNVKIFALLADDQIAA
jgi:hypothetical protein